MEVTRIIAEIDAQIAKLQQARELLSGVKDPVRRGPGRPKGSRNASSAKTSATTSAATKTAAKTGRTRKLTPEGRKRIADAMKRRWAERRKQAAGSK